jgi:membrane protease YdiL (CAAX protease family)
MIQVNKSDLRALNAFWAGALAFGLIFLTGAVWLALIVGNLKTTPSIPWSIVVMAALLWAIWQYFNGRWKPESTAGIRHHLMRANFVPRRTLVWALLAGMFSIVALVSFWIVLSEVVELPKNATLNSSSYRWYFPFFLAVMASISGSITEEIGFRGYFQKTLEMKWGGTLAIIISAVVIFPAHALTQRFVLPVLVFYLLVDLVLGTMAYLTNSILPGAVVHAVGLFVFLFLVWPNSTRRLVLESGPDIWFWVNAAQMMMFAAAALWAFKRLASAASREIVR